MKFVQIIVLLIVIICRHCLFCKQTEASILAVSNSMNSHYWRMCPMLVRCKECSQVIEVATLVEHLVIECEHRENYTQCPQCTEAVRLDDFENHANSCIGKDKHLTQILLRK